MNIPQTKLRDMSFPVKIYVKLGLRYKTIQLELYLSQFWLIYRPYLYIKHDIPRLGYI